jgi:hypothetical protein
MGQLKKEKNMWFEVYATECVSAGGIKTI